MDKNNPFKGKNDTKYEDESLHTDSYQFVRQTEPSKMNPVQLKSEALNTAPSTAPEITQPSQVLQLIKGTTSSVTTDNNYVSEGAKANNSSIVELDEPVGEYDPNRGDRVDVLNDTTPPPVRLQPIAVPRKKNNKKRWPWLILLLVLIAVGVYFTFGYFKATVPARRQSIVRKSIKLPTSTVTKHYDSNAYSLGMDYPTDWQLKDGDTSLTVTSPPLSLMKSDGSITNGYIQLSIEATQTSLPQFVKGAAVATLTSQKITYTKPTVNQRTATNLTFASYSTTENNGWDALYVTGDNSYTLGQTIPMTDIIQTDPLVQVHFLSCIDQSCSGAPIPINLQINEWQNSAVSSPLKTIIQSFTFN